MCRLYGFRATEPTKVECTLVHAQNALMVQSRGDLAGLEHGHGWGVATYEDHEPQVERQAWAAYHGEHFQRAAARVYSCTVLAHVRRATVGKPGLLNTHPFRAGPWAFAHNGTVPHFERLRERMLRETAPAHVAAIQGETDSEHVFRLLLTRIEAAGTRELLAVLRDTIDEIVTWCRALDPQAPIGLNL
ncbi:MAG: class II glutamine amidotransferase, partial [Burkholderiales bacterium]